VLCQGRGEPGRDLCAACARDLIPNPVCCLRCAQPLFRTRGRDSLCGRCLGAHSIVESSFVPYRYVYPLDRLIQRLKYGHALSAARVLGELFAERHAELGSHPPPELIIPVPLGVRRYRERGFNQAYELARAVSRRSNIEIRSDLVERTRETQEQAGLPRRQRRRNVRGAFRLARPLTAAHVAIFDDVVTTGSTVNELAKALRRAGARTIEVWAIARAGR
jgi:ComF family protein